MIQRRQTKISAKYETKAKKYATKVGHPKMYPFLHEKPKEVGRKKSYGYQKSQYTI